MQKSFTVKLWKLMKICAAQTFIALTLCGVTVAHSNFAQILDKQITISLTDTPFEEALKEIENAANIKFAYSISQLRNEAPVTFRAEQRLLSDILSDLFGPRNIRYKVHEREKTITLKKYSEVRSNGESHIEMTTDDLQSDVLQITGTVKDATTQQPMAGVNVIVRGTTRGTTSDANGNFTVEANDGEVLVFSFIGYAPLEIKLSGQSQIDVQLQEDITSLKEVVVNAGYWTVKKEEQTGNIVKVESEEIQKQPVANPLAALQGRVAGLEVTQTTGLPGGNFTIRIRGENSIGNGNDPLYIIDGVPFTSTPQTFAETSGDIFPNGFGTSPFNYLNPADIESIEILKDADATSLYGSRGANGVVLITTKKGKKGKTSVNLTYTEGIGRLNNAMKLLNTKDYVRMRREAFANDDLVPTEVAAPDLLLWDTTRYTDWQKVLAGNNSSYRDVQISLSGGEKNTVVSSGIGYHKETAVFAGDNDDQRFSTHVTARNRSENNKLTTTVTVNYGFNKTDFISKDLMRDALLLPPNAPALYDADGNLDWGAESWNSGIPNPLAFTKRSYESQTHTLVGNLNLSYAILPNLEIRINGGGTSIVNRSLTLDPASSYDPAVSALTENSAAYSSNYFTNWIAEPQIHSNFKIGNGELTAMVGSSFMSQLSEGSAQYARGFANEALMRNINAAGTINLSSSIYSLYRYNAVFGRINYVLNDKYFLNLTARRDGSSRFGPGRKFANFGAVGAAWIFSRESFSPAFLSFGKLRMSYGTSGNDQIGDYQYLDTYSGTGSGFYQGIRGLSPQRLFNEDFAWEKIRKAEIGLELGFIEDRLIAGFSFFRNRSSNQLLGNILPPTAGFGVVQSNLPAIVQNSGLEVQLTSQNVKNESFSFTTSLNFSLPRNKLVEFPNLENSPQYAHRLAEGEPMKILKVYRVAGIDQSTGQYSFIDENDDGEINVLDRRTIAFYGQEFYGGLTNSLAYKNFEMDFHFQFVKQSGYNYLNYFSTAPGRPSNQPTWVTDRWTEDNRTSEMQQYSTLSDYQNAYFNLMTSDRSISDASFIRLKNVSLSYSFGASTLEKMKMENMKIFVQAQNVFTVTGYKGLDPETQSSSLPPLQVFTAGIHLTF